MLVWSVSERCILKPDIISTLHQRDSFVQWITQDIQCVSWNADRLHKANFLCVLSLRAQETFLQWDQFRRFYNFLMADNMKKIILSHRYLFVLHAQF